MNKLIKIVLCCLVCALPACNKTGAYGFKEGQRYVSSSPSLISNLDAVDTVTFRVIEATWDYVVFTKEGIEAPNPWYNRKVSGNELKRYSNIFFLKD